MKKLKNLNKQKKTIIYGVALLTTISLSFLTYNFIAKGATYGWLQATWSGGADTGAVANHTSNQSGWTKFFSKDTNVDTSNDQLTLSSGSSSVVDTTTANFGAGTWNTDTNSASCINSNTTGDQMTGTNACYNAGSFCGNFQVLPTDRVGTTNWTTAMSYCDSLCATCDLPTSTEWSCIYTYRANLGNNFGADIFWSATEYNSTDANIIMFSLSGLIGNTPKTNSNLAVRCIHRY